VCHLHLLVFSKIKKYFWAFLSENICFNAQAEMHTDFYYEIFVLAKRSRLSRYLHMNRHLKYGEAGHVVQWQKTFLACKKS
jgi:hypothetical protein